MTESPLDARPRVIHRTLATAAALALMMTTLTPARAAETQWWILDKAADHAESRTDGIVITPEGTLRLGPRTSSHTDDSLGVLWSAAKLADGSVALGSDRGRIRRWNGKGIEPWLELSAGQVLTLAADGKGLLAGTAPDGVIYRIGERGDTSVFARTGERYVWALAPGGSNVWYAATGTQGRVLRIEGGKTRVVLDTEASNITTLTPDGKGGVYAGGDSQGRVYHVRADGTTRTLFEAEEDEIRALAVGADGALYAAALDASAVTGALAPAPAPTGGASAEREARENPDSDDDGEEIRPTRATRGRAVVYRIVPDSTASAHWTAPAPVVYALARASTGMIAATGNRAGVFALTRPFGALHWLSAPQGQITALIVDGRAANERVIAAASNPAAVWVIGPARADKGELISPVLDARRIARLGKAIARGEPKGGRIELSTRTGNTNPPDTTWSAWRSVGKQGASESPPGRFAQWKLVLAGGDPEVEAVEVSWREQNLAPRVTGIVVAPQGAAFREGDLTPRSEPVTQTLPGGQKVSYSVPPAQSNRELRELPAWARGLRTVQWRGSDPNGDPLIYRVDVAPSTDGPWTLVADDLDQSAFTWDTQSLADGRYRLRVTASDLPGNAVGEEREDFTVSPPFQIDNTAPTLSEVTATGVAGGIRVSGTARDGSSPLTRIEVAVDDGEWRVITPEGGFADDLDLEFRATVSPVEPGEHSVGVRAIDRAGNSTTRAVRVRVPAGR